MKALTQCDVASGIPLSSLPFADPADVEKLRRQLVSSFSSISTGHSSHFIVRFRTPGGAGTGAVAAASTTTPSVSSAVSGTAERPPAAVANELQTFQLQTLPLNFGANLSVRPRSAATAKVAGGGVTNSDADCDARSGGGGGSAGAGDSGSGTGAVATTLAASAGGAPKRKAPLLLCIARELHAKVVSLSAARDGLLTDGERGSADDDGTGGRRSGEELELEDRENAEDLESGDSGFDLRGGSGGGGGGFAPDGNVGHHGHRSGGARSRTSASVSSCASGSRSGSAGACDRHRDHRHRHRGEDGSDEERCDSDGGGRADDDEPGGACTRAMHARRGCGGGGGGGSSCGGTVRRGSSLSSRSSGGRSRRSGGGRSRNSGGGRSRNSHHGGSDVPRGHGVGDLGLAVRTLSGMLETRSTVTGASSRALSDLDSLSTWSANTCEEESALVVVRSDDTAAVVGCGVPQLPTPVPACLDSAQGARPHFVLWPHGVMHLSVVCALETVSPKLSALEQQQAERRLTTSEAAAAAATRLSGPLFWPHQGVTRCVVVFVIFVVSKLLSTPHTFYVGACATCVFPSFTQRTLVTRAWRPVSTPLLLPASHASPTWVMAKKWAQLFLARRRTRHARARLHARERVVCVCECAGRAARTHEHDAARGSDVRRVWDGRLGLVVAASGVRTADVGRGRAALRRRSRGPWHRRPWRGRRWIRGRQRVRVRRYPPSGGWHARGAIECRLLLQ